jgi:Fe-Mn family superoxide dismutase
MPYPERKFDLPTLADISKASIDAHLTLYAGYVKNFNAITAKIDEYLKDSATHAQALSELMRRKSFEFGGMRLHELYFSQWEGAETPLVVGGPLESALKNQFGSVEVALTHIKQTGMMRGPGWSLLYWDKMAGVFHVGFSGEQHQGHFASLPIVLALDVWEHAYLLDHGVSGKDKYIDAFFKNINWQVVEQRFSSISK